MAEFDINALSGIFPGVDATSMQALLAQLQPSEEDKKRARREGLMSMGLSILANPYKGQEFQSIGNAGLLGMQTQRSSLADLTKERGSTLTQAAALQGLGRKAAQDQRMAGLRDKYADPTKATAPVQPPPSGPVPTGPLAGSVPRPPVAPPPGATPSPQIGGVPGGTPVDEPPPPPAAAPPPIFDPQPPLNDLLDFAYSGPEGAKMAEIIERRFKSDVTRDGIFMQGGVPKARALPNGIEYYQNGDITKKTFVPMAPEQVAATVSLAAQVAEANENAKMGTYKMEVTEIGKDGKPVQVMKEIQMTQGRYRELTEPKKPTTSVTMKGGGPPTPEQQAQITAQGGPIYGVGPGPTQLAKEAGENVTEQKRIQGTHEYGLKVLEEYRHNYKASLPIRGSLERLISLNEQGIIGGATGGITQQGAQVLNSLFGTSKDVSRWTANTEAYRSEISTMVQSISKSFPGAQSDKELVALMESLPTTMLTPAGREKVLYTLLRKSKEAEVAFDAIAAHYKTDPTLMSFKDPYSGPPILWKPLEKFKLRKDASLLAQQAYKTATREKSQRLMEELVLTGDVE